MIDKGCLVNSDEFTSPSSITRSHHKLSRVIQESQQDSESGMAVTNFV